MPTETEATKVEPSFSPEAQLSVELPIAVTADSFTPEEHAALDGLEIKYQDLRTNALLVAKGHFTGLYAYGPGGVGKTHQVRKTLETAHQPYTLINTHITGAALFRKMQASPNGLFLIEDMETLFDDKVARNALRAALWGERSADGKMVRRVKYSTLRDEVSFDFSGGIIFTMNRPLKDIPEVAALATRILVTSFLPNRDELLAITKKIALAGYLTDKGTLSQIQALEVYRYYREQLDRSPDRLPDLRLLFKGFEYRLAASLSSLPDNTLRWQESFRAQLEQSQEAVVHDRKVERLRQEALAQELYLRRQRGEINSKEMLARFKAATGISSTQTFYNRLRSADARFRSAALAATSDASAIDGSPV